MPPYPLSSFRRTQVNFELRYDPAYPLWDTTGAIWQSVKRQFKTFKHNQVSPNEQTFTGDNRFVLLVALERAVITDHKPTGSASSSVEVMSAFADLVVKRLQIPVLNRVGTRVLYALKCNSDEEARARAVEMMPMVQPKSQFFGIKPSSIAPHLKIEASDGELAYSVNLHSSEKRFELELPAELSSMNVDQRNETWGEVVLDVDFFTKKPIPIDSFNSSVWLNGWHKMLGRDTDKFLDWLRSSHG